MNFKNILQNIEHADPEVYERLSGRRQVLKSFGSKVAVAALPFAIGSLFKKAYGKTTDAVIDALNLALELEFMEYTFYRHANNTGGLIPASELPGFQVIEAHEKAHIEFLITAIDAMGGTHFAPNHYTDPTTTFPYVPAAYDFTKGGTYNTFGDYATFLKLAQTLEDTGVHAYKGQMAELLGNNAVLVQAFQIQAVEARHAAHVRYVRRMAGAPEEPAPWITLNVAPSVDLQAYYNGEDTLSQNGVNLTTLGDSYDTSGYVPKVSSSAAFDEAFDKARIATLIAPFKRP